MTRRLAFKTVTLGSGVKSAPGCPRQKGRIGRRLAPSTSQHVLPRNKKAFAPCALRAK